MRKLFTLALACMLGTSLAQAQTITIQDARTRATGQVVTVAGRVINGGELGPIRYIDDGTGGIGIYFSTAQLTANPINRNDSILVTGTIAPYNNLMELTPIANYTVVSQNNPPKAPVEFGPANWTAAFNEAYEGRLVKLTQVPTVTTSSGGAIGTFVGNTNYRINGNANLALRVVNTSVAPDGIVGKPAPTDTFSVIGVMSQFSASNPTAGYQLLPRLYEDFVGSDAPNIISSINQVDVTQTSLTLSFTTAHDGDTKFEYGSTTALGFVVSDATMGTAHSLTINNLDPGKLYWVKASSTNGAGTSTSGMAVFVTESNSTGAMKTYFTRPVNTTVALPGNNAVFLDRAMDDTLIAYINRAHESLDIAIYNWNNNGLSDITAAVNAAYLRGVKVRIVNDGSSANIGLNTLNPGIKHIESPQGSIPGMSGSFYGIMHNKFMIVDAESADPNRPLVWTGSTNWTQAMMNSDWNNTIIVQDQSLARVYKLEFEEMWGSDSLRPGAVYNGSTGTARFGPYKRDNTPHTIKISGKLVNSYFSPSDNAQGRLIETINSANSSFHFSIYTFTRTEIAYAFRDKYQALGANNCSRGLLDDTSNTGAGDAFRIMASRMGNNVNIYTPAGIYHHKYLIVDQDAAASDPILFTGSYNWSAAANLTNDENTLIVHDQAIANQYYQEFTQRWIDDGQSTCIVSATAPMVASKLHLAPNPASDQIKVTSSGLAGKTIQVVGTDGRVAQSLRASSDNQIVGVETLAPGAYLVRVEGVAVPVRFIKQ